MRSPENELRFRVSEAQAGERLDKLVAQAARVSRRVARTWIATGRVLVGRKPLRILTRPMRAGAEVAITRAEPASAPSARAAPGDTSRAAGPGRTPGGSRAGGAAVAGASASVPERPPLAVLYVDRYLLVVDKPAGLLTEHDRFGSPAVESLAPALLAGRGERGERTRIWLVHRLDAGTSGVLVLARTPMAARVLGEAFRAGAVKKTYLALCRGRLEGERRVDAPIARAERTRHVVSPGGKPAETDFAGLSASDAASLVRAEPRTGRTHQIRVHLAHLGHPLLGDGLYGGPMYTAAPRPEPIPRPMLHAHRLRLAHPKTGAALVFEAPLPADFLSLAARSSLPTTVEEPS